MATQLDPTAAPSPGAEPSPLQEIPAQAHKRPGEEAYEDAKRGLLALFNQVFGRTQGVSEIDRPLIDMFIAEIEARLSAQIDEILHHPTFQKLEAAWRGL